VNTVLKPNRIGYAHIASSDENSDEQLRALERVGAQRLFIDRGLAGGTSKPPELVRCLEALQSGDTLVVERLGRLGRTVCEVVETVDDLRARGVHLLCVREPINTAGPYGLWVSRVFMALRLVEQNESIEKPHGETMPAMTLGLTSGPNSGSSRQDCVLNSGTHKKCGSQAKTLIMTAARRLALKGDGWFLAADLQVIDPDSGKPLNRRTRDSAIRQLVAENLLEEGIPVPSGKRGKPARRHRIVAMPPDASALNGLVAQS
jgi:Resolvase, N terminal domain